MPLGYLRCSQFKSSGTKNGTRGEEDAGDGKGQFWIKAKCVRRGWSGIATGVLSDADRRADEPCACLSLLLTWHWPHGAMRGNTEANISKVLNEVP